MHIMSHTSLVSSGGSCAFSEQQRPTATDLSTLRGVQNDGHGVTALPLASLHNPWWQPCATLPADRSVAIEFLHENRNR